MHVRTYTYDLIEKKKNMVYKPNIWGYLQKFFFISSFQ